MNIILLLICWSLWYLIFSSRFILSPLLPVIEAEFLISHTLAGSLFLFLTAGMIICYLFISSWLTFRVGYKRAILLSLLFMSVFIFLMGYMRSYDELALLLFVVGLGSGLYIPNVIPIFTSVFDQRNWGRAISFHETGPTASTLTIPLLTVILLKYIEWRSLFIVLSAALLFVATLFWRFSPNPRPKEKIPFTWRSLLTKRVFWIILVVYTMAAVANNAVFSITPLFLIHERGFDMDTANRVFGYTRAGGLVVTLIVGLLLDRTGAKPVMLATLLITGLSTIALAKVSGFGWIVTMMLLQATVSVVFFPAVLFGISKLTTLQERGAFTSISIGVATLIGVGCSPVFMGAVADRWSFEAGMILVGAVTTLSCLLFRWLPKI
jgi:MFS transporter, NNP family, nitrate/nitrite transporter